jgi:hypothetical protein
VSIKKIVDYIIFLKGIMKKSGAQYEKWMKKIEADMKKN